MRTFDWILKPGADPEAVRDLSIRLNNLPEALARCLYLRGVRSFDEARLFFRGGAESLHAPGRMAGMDDAVNRLVKAIRSRERVVVYGDYDVDGTTSTAMMTHFLRERGVPAAFFIPDRLRHGYGLCRAGVEEAATMGATLLVAIDCGVTAVEEVELAGQLGLDVVICDHHTPPETLPAALAILNPKRSDCVYPFGELCGCGVAFKLINAVSAALGEGAEAANQYLDLVALATAADVVPLRGENRILLREGILRLQSQPRLGIRKLAEEARVTLEQCDARAIQFGLAPRINAAGRLGDAKRAVRLLLTDDEQEAADRARQLERVNTDRRALDRAVLDQAQERAEEILSGERRSVVLYDPGWHLGVVGIVAARIVDRHHVPTILLGAANGLAKGSARSIPGVNVYDALVACRDLLTTFGGHDYAAGLALPPEAVATFTDRFDEAVRHVADDATFRRKLAIDAELDLNDVDQRFWAVLDQFSPFGAENDPPLFVSRGVRIASPPRRAGKSGDHIKLRVAGENGPSHEVIGFGLGDRFDALQACHRSGDGFDAAFNLAENSWNGVRTVQLQLRDVDVPDHLL